MGVNFLRKPKQAYVSRAKIDRALLPFSGRYVRGNGEPRVTSGAGGGSPLASSPPSSSTIKTNISSASASIRQATALSITTQHQSPEGKRNPKSPVLFSYLFPSASTEMAAAVFSSSSSLPRDGRFSSGHLPVPPSRGQPDSLMISDSRRRSSMEVGSLSFKASREATVLAQEVSVCEPKKSMGPDELDPFEEMKHRFLTFKNQQFLKNLDHFENLAEAQAPKFMVIACADSRVCPSKVLGIQPGEAFTIRNVANLVPAFESGPSETNAALEFAVNTLEVGNIFVIGHSRCGGIRALMSMQSEVNSSGFLENWVITGRHARAAAKGHSASLNFDQQCKHCEKESINQSLLRLLTYPWIEDKVRRGKLSIHGGYYDFISCTFEKWTLDYKGRQGYAIKDRCFWS